MEGSVGMAGGVHVSDNQVVEYTHIDEPDRWALRTRHPPVDTWGWAPGLVSTRAGSCIYLATR